MADRHDRRFILQGKTTKTTKDTKGAADRPIRHQGRYDLLSAEERLAGRVNREITPYAA